MGRLNLKNLKEANTAKLKKNSKVHQEDYETPRKSESLQLVSVPRLELGFQTNRKECWRIIWWENEKKWGAFPSDERKFWRYFCLMHFLPDVQNKSKGSYYSSEYQTLGQMSLKGYITQLLYTTTLQSPERRTNFQGFSFHSLSSSSFTITLSLDATYSV